MIPTAAPTPAGLRWSLLEPGIARLELSNPGRLHALNRDMWLQMAQIVPALEARADLRCVVVTGADATAFAAGSDIREFETDRANAAQAQTYGEVVAAGLAALEGCAVPLVAQIRGACVGGGLAVAALCDLRICGRSSRFGVPVSRLGLVMAHAEMRGLHRLAGAAVMREMLLEGRVFGADEALGKGLVTRVVDDEAVAAEALQAARRIAAGAPLVARWHKRFIRRLEDPRPLTPEEKGEAYACFDTQDYRIGLQAFLGGTPPVFTGS